MNVKPLKDRVFATFVAEAEKTASGIIIPEAAKEKPQRANVVAVGGEVKEVKVGDTILFEKYSGSKLKADDQECLIIKEEDILGILV